MRLVETTGDTVEEAVEMALAELRLTRAEVEIEVVDQGGPGLPAKVRVAAGGAVTEPDGTFKGPREGALSTGEVLEYARDDTLDFLEGLLEAMGLDGQVTAGIEEGGITASVVGEDLGVLIGRHGRTLEAVQELLRAAVQRQAQSRVRVNLDIEGYREARRQVVEAHAQEMAQRALRMGEVRLDPMAPFERKVVHDTVAQIEGVESESEGEEPQRGVVIRRVREVSD